MPRGDDSGKIFVGGLSYETTKEGLESYFSKYGEIGDCVIMKAKDQVDPRIERSRGFGFVTFHDPSCVQKVIDSRPHYLDNKEIDPKPAVPRAPGSAGPLPIPKTAGSRSFKIFIGGVAQGTTEEDLKIFFQTFGPVADVSLMKDVKTGRMRGFGFVGFHTEEPVTKICAIRYHQINGKTVEAKKAEPRDSRTPSVIGGNSGMGRGMAMQNAYAVTAGYGMGAYGGADARMYGAGYGGQAVSAQAGHYGVPAASVPASQYSGFVTGNSIPASYAERTGVAVAQDPGAQAYGGMYGAVGAPSSAAAANARYNDFAGVPQGQPIASQAAAIPTRSEVAGAEYGAGYGVYGLGSYQQEASQYGPTRGGLSEVAFAGGAGAGAAGAGVPTSVYGGEPGGYPAASMYDGMGRGAGGNASRGYHPYGR
ncbi:RNA-binding protein Musashi homolog 2-like isoform X2 [Dendronephthya gigantea]|uniref:RNA-binding protein Musashi homolog 2-like isoform X2 n=1 Tax=Dendronephthya gigantea TaxID=151771 RepID=UPI00106941B1|nr:RNA-binding protein Musashi homolog 2-like isoform X2 [Dendronephthya gigantea]